MKVRRECVFRLHIEVENACKGFSSSIALMDNLRESADIVAD